MLFNLSSSVLSLRTLEDKLKGMCRTKEMFTAITKKLDKIREQGKTPTVTDIIQTSQMQEEVFERSEIDQLTLNLNLIEEDELLTTHEPEGDQNMRDSPEYDNNPQYQRDEYQERRYNQNQERRYDQNQEGRYNYNMGHGYGHPNYNNYNNYYRTSDYHKGRNYYPQRKYYEQDQWHGRQNQQNYGQQGKMERHNYGYNRYTNQRKYPRDQPWVPITQRVYYEETNNLDDTKGEEDKETDDTKKDDEKDDPIVY